MATKKTSSSTAVVKWDEELAKQAQIAAGMEESTATGQFFGLKGGRLSFNDAPIPGNTMGVVILDAILENVHYDGEFDPDNPQAPDCFAFGREDSVMAPHKIVLDGGTNHASACSECEFNKFGSADKGRGKACRNTRRLAMIPAGTIDAQGKFKAFTDLEHFEKAGLAFMKLPVTSVKGYAAYVKQAAGALKRPPFGLFTRVTVVPDDKSQFKVLFEAISTVPDDLMPTVMERHKEAEAAIDFPYLPFEEEAEAKPKKGVRPAAKKATRRKY